MTEAVLIWAYVSPMPFVWCRTFFGLRWHRALGARWLLASVIALVWPLYGAQFVAWRRWHQSPTEPPVGDQIEREFQALYP